MLKKNLKELVIKKQEIATISFQILNEKQAANISGGCRVLQSCGVFSGNCDRLLIGSCGRFYAQ